ncbi:MAG: hypothetical protein V4577_01760 [Bacteroidota bacterium]
MSIPDGVTPTVYVTVGGERIEVIFDTGSSGLRILKGVLKSATLTDLHKRIRYSYGDEDYGLNVSGELVEGYFNLDRLRSKLPIAFMAIDSVQYVRNGKPFDWIPTGDQTFLSKDSTYFSGFYGSMGVGMRVGDDGVGSPIPQMPGNGVYMVHFPQAGLTYGGVLILNPSSGEISKFKNMQQLNPGKYQLANGVKGYEDDALDGTLSIAGVNYAAPTLLDTANPAVWTESPFLTGTEIRTPGTIVTMALQTLPAKTSTTFKVNNAQLAVDFVKINHNTGKTANSFGAQFFFDYDVLYDAVKGQIWIAGK